MITHTVGREQNVPTEISHQSQACLYDNQYTRFYSLQTPPDSLHNLQGNTWLSLWNIPTSPPLPSYCCGSSYTSWESISIFLFMLTTSTWRSTKRKKFSQSESEERWGGGGGGREEEEYIKPKESAYAGSDRFLPPSTALLLTSGNLSLSHSVSWFLSLSYFCRLFPFALT